MPPTPWVGYRRLCPLALALDVLGERWTLVIAHELSFGPRRYSDLVAQLPGVSPNVLSKRLRTLMVHGLVEKTIAPGSGHAVYQLSELGGELDEVFRAIRGFGMRHFDQLGQGADFDLSYLGDRPSETFEYNWSIDGEETTLVVVHDLVEQRVGHSPDAIGSMTTSRHFLHRLGRFDTTWDDGLATGEVIIQGPETALRRVLSYTGLDGSASNRHEQDAEPHS